MQEEVEKEPCVTVQAAKLTGRVEGSDSSWPLRKMEQQRTTPTAATV